MLGFEFRILGVGLIQSLGVEGLGFRGWGLGPAPTH